MADYAIGEAFLKAHRSILRIIPLTKPCRYYPVRDEAGWITMPNLKHGDQYLPLLGLQQATFQVDYVDKEFRLIGDGGWTDSVATGGKVMMSAQSFFMKDVLETDNCPVIRGDYDKAFKGVIDSRNDRDLEVYVELLKDMGRKDGATGNYIYDFCGYNGVIRGYNEPQPADDMVLASFNINSRGNGVFGKYDAGSSPIEYGDVFSSLLTTAGTTGSRRWAVTPADNASAIATSSNITVAYTSDGTTPLTQLQLANGGAGFRLEAGSSGTPVPCSVSLTGGVVTINPTPTLASGTIHRLVVRDGAINQLVNASGVADPAGFRRPLQGFVSQFVTA